MKKIMFLMILIVWATMVQGQVLQNGRVVDSRDSTSLEGALLHVVGTNVSTGTDERGYFSLHLAAGKYELEVSYIGFEKRTIPITIPHIGTKLEISLEPILEVMETVEVISSGYFFAPKERSTGSYVHVNNELLNRSAELNILDRIEGVAGSMTYDRKPNGATDIRIRGLSTFHADRAPLIILDNFPYEGELDNINPNDIESITILRDGAATSIWGARAGNGVIVLTSKKGKYNDRFQINFNSNLSMVGKSDLTYDRSYIPAEAYIDYEIELFERGYYNNALANRNMGPVSPVVEWLAANRSGDMDDNQLTDLLNELRETNSRDEVAKYIFRSPLRRQYALQLRGGSTNFHYILSGNLDREKTEAKLSNNSKINTNLQVSYKPTSRLELTAGYAFMDYAKKVDGISNMTGLAPVGTPFYPYGSFFDEHGNPAAFVRNHRLSYAQHALESGLLDWTFRPMAEMDKMNHWNELFESRISLGTTYEVWKGLSMDIKYQYQKLNRVEKQLYLADSYYVRDLVNKYTQADGSKPFPEGDILRYSYQNSNIHNGRLQWTYFQEIGPHQLYGLAGVEARQNHFQEDGNELLGYDHEVLTYGTIVDFSTRFPTRPTGTARIPNGNIRVNDQVERFLSYYSNFSYHFNGQYSLSASVRWDGSNLFGVSANQKGVPLWSVGGLWNVSKESFFTVPWLSLFQFRATYGVSGNIDRLASAQPIVSYGNSPLTGLRSATITKPGNKELTWESVNMLNLGLNVESINKRLVANVEFYFKRSTDLLGNKTAEPTTGYLTDRTPYMVNYASMKTDGVDLEWMIRILTGRLKWNINSLNSYAFSRVTRYEDNYANTPIGVFTNEGGIGNRALTGASPDLLLSYPFLGLNPQDGSLQIPEGYSSYANYFSSLQLSDLVESGVRLPPYWGSLRNTFLWKNLEISMNISYKLKYNFRRSTFDNSRALSTGEVHEDYLMRWRNPGDELFTDVPSFQYAANATRDGLYTNSTVTIEKADHVKIEDVFLSCEFPGVLRSSIKRLRVFMNYKPHVILWKASKLGVDPVYKNASSLPGSQLSLGIHMTL